MTSLLFGQHPLSTIGKNIHLTQMSDGVLMVRLSSQDSKIAELQKRGQTKTAQNLSSELKIQNDAIIKAFQTHFTFCPVYFIKPNDTKTIINNKPEPVVDLATGKTIHFSEMKNIYVTDFSYGHPAEGNERYNRKGFQILSLENGKIYDIGRDLFYAGVKQGIFSSKFEKSLQKTIYKLNRRLHTGSKYF